MRQFSRLLIILLMATYPETSIAADWEFGTLIAPSDVFGPIEEPCFRLDEVIASCVTPAEHETTAGSTEADVFYRSDVNDLLRETEAIVIRAQNGGMFGAGTRLRFDYSEDYNDEVRIHGQLMTQLSGQFGMDAEATWYDKTRNSDVVGELWTGDANLVYKLDVSRITLRFGGGAAYALEEGDTKVGYNFTYGTDFYIRRPFLVSGEIDWGQISSDQLFHWRVTAGFVYGSLEIFGGYDSYELGEFDIDGPVAGLGIVF